MEIAADSSSLIAFFNGERGADIDCLKQGMRNRSVFLPPPVLAELFSSAAVRNVEKEISLLPVLPVLDGYWRRAGETRFALLSRKLKSRLADALICQSCLDAGIALITRDTDFRHYAKWAGLKLA